MTVLLARRRSLALLWRHRALNRQVPHDDLVAANKRVDLVIGVTEE